MTLTFASPEHITALDAPDALDLTPVHTGLWSFERDREVQAARRLGGVVVQPASVVLGLRGWEDAFEGVDAQGDPWVFFELEKIIRMTMRGSGLAFEILAAPRCAASSFDARALLSMCLTRQVVAHYRDVTASLRSCSGSDVAPSRALLRERLMGAVLGRDGVVAWSWSQLVDLWPAPDLDAMLEVWDADARAEVGALVSALGAWLEPETCAALPERPSDYQGANDLLVELRLNS